MAPSEAGLDENGRPGSPIGTRVVSDRVNGCGAPGWGVSFHSFTVRAALDAVASPQGVGSPVAGVPAKPPAAKPIVAVPRAGTTVTCGVSAISSRSHGLTTPPSCAHS